MRALTIAAALAVATCALAMSAAIADPINRADVHVKDGDTIVIGSGNGKHSKDQEYRLVGFDTPETTRGKCPAEIEKGNRAAARLAALLDSGRLDLTEIQCSCAPGAKQCNYGRRCGRLTVNGRDVGEILIAENLAVPFICEPPPAKSSQPCPKQRNWCQEVGPLPQSPKSPPPPNQLAGGCLIKGNINSKGEHIYHMPGQKFYDNTVIDESQGERWFCTEDEAIGAGWRKSKV
jgi:endonuclease YncB( thermonuclease family)